MVAIPSAISIPLLFQDASDILLGALLQPTWGVYLNGMPVLQPAGFAGTTGGFAGTLASVVQVAGTIGNIVNTIGNIGSILQGTSPMPVVPAYASTVEFDYSQEMPLSNYPQEQGAFQTYNKVTLPYDIRLRVCSGGSVSARQGFLYTCLAIKDSFQLFTVITPEMTFSNCNCNHISWRRTAKRNNTLIEVDLGFVQVPILSSAANFLNTLFPGDASQLGLGGVQAQLPFGNASNFSLSNIFG